VTLEPWYADEIGGSPEDVGYRLYRGATVQAPVNGMFSFFPARPAGEHARGFARPRIRHAHVSDRKPQGFKLTPVTLEEATVFWRAIRDQVINADLWLGTGASMPLQEM
jgi:hypothetical protein